MFSLIRFKRIMFRNIFQRVVRAPFCCNALARNLQVGTAEAVMADILKIKSFYEDETIFEDVLGFRAQGLGFKKGLGLRAHIGLNS